MSTTTHPSPSGDTTRFEIELSVHCVERFNERLRPCLDREQAEEELVRLLSDFGEITFDRPVWIRPFGADRASAWVLIGPSVALPLLDTGGSFLAATVLVGGGISRGERSRRNGRRKARRTRRRF